MEEKESKCKTCIRLYSYRTATGCRYCKENKEKYWGRSEARMVEDNYREAKRCPGDENIPY